MINASSKLLQGVIGSSHPGPTLVVTTLAAAMGVAAGLGLGRMLLLAAVVFIGQLSVGLSNDAVDAKRDRLVGRTDKPVARGDISVTTAWIAAIGCAVLALVGSVPLGVGFLSAHAVLLVSAWAYNLGLKATAFSVVPFITGFGAFPSFAALALPEPQVAAVWASIAGAALGTAVHLTNVLPDLDDDARTSIRGFPHRIGAGPSAVFAAVTVLTGAAAVTLGPVSAHLGEVSWVSWVLAGVTASLAVATLVLVVAGHSGRVLFRLVMTSALVMAVQLVVSGGSLTA